MLIEMLVGKYTTGNSMNADDLIDMYEVKKAN